MRILQIIFQIWTRLLRASLILVRLPLARLMARRDPIATQPPPRPDAAALPPCPRHHSETHTATHPATHPGTASNAAPGIRAVTLRFDVNHRAARRIG